MGRGWELREWFLPRGVFDWGWFGDRVKKGLVLGIAGRDLFWLLFARSSITMDAVKGSCVLSRVPKTNVSWGWGCSGVSGVTTADVDSAGTGVGYFWFPRPSWQVDGKSWGDLVCLDFVP